MSGRAARGGASPLRIVERLAVSSADEMPDGAAMG
jgi:hypothetical protein